MQAWAHSLPLPLLLSRESRFANLVRRWHVLYALHRLWHMSPEPELAPAALIQTRDLHQRWLLAVHPEGLI